MSENDKKELDYDRITKSIDSIKHYGHVESIANMIDLFNSKWKRKDDFCELNDTIEIRGILKHKIKQLELVDVMN